MMDYTPPVKRNQPRPPEHPPDRPLQISGAIRRSRYTTSVSATINATATTIHDAKRGDIGAHPALTHVRAHRLQPYP